MMPTFAERLEKIAGYLEEWGHAANEDGNHEWEKAKGLFVAAEHLHKEAATLKSEIDMKIEIHRVMRSDGEWEELYINDRRCVSYPAGMRDGILRRGIDGNQVAHSVCLELKKQGISSSYEYVNNIHRKESEK